MGRDDYSEAALVLLGHGTELNAESATPVYQHAGELRRRRCFAEVREAFWKQEPRLFEVLESLAVPKVFLVPMFISEGYFSEEVIPEALGFEKDPAGQRTGSQQRGAQMLAYCKPIGTHESMTAVLLARAREVIERFPFPRPARPQETTLFIAGHGTSQNENSRQAVENQVKLVSIQKLYAGVHGVFLEEEPRIPACYQLAQTRNVVMVPFFISDGMHVAEDIPVLLGEPERIVRERQKSGQPTWRNPTEKHGKLVWYSSSVGTNPLIAQVILDRVAEAARQLVA